MAIKTRWELDQDELEDVTDAFGPNALKSNVVTVCRRYNSPDPNGPLTSDLGAAFQHLFDKHGFDAQERQALGEIKDTKCLIATLEKLGTPTEKHTALLTKLREYGTVTRKIQALIEPYLPQFMYFANYDRMEGAVQIEQLNALVSNRQIDADEHRGRKLFREFFDYAGVPLNEIQSVTTYETFNAKFEGASNRITEQVLEYWTQNPDLDVRVKIENARPGDPAPFNSGTIAGRESIINSIGWRRLFLNGVPALCGSFRFW